MSDSDEEDTVPMPVICFEDTQIVSVGRMVGRPQTSSDWPPPPPPPLTRVARGTELPRPAPRRAGFYRTTSGRS